MAWNSWLSRAFGSKSGALDRARLGALIALLGWMLAGAVKESAPVGVTAAVESRKPTTLPGNQAIENATRSVEAAVPRAEADPTRPVYHFRPPAQWMNDPNGTIHYEGFYHVFYQHNPYGDRWDNMHWGHARSKDLVHWEHMPIALWPSKEKGEDHCFSGCAAIDGKGQPLLLYTSVAREGRPNEQWAALGDENLIAWRKHPSNPILSLETHGGPKFGGSWRDPFVFREAGRTFLVLGAETEDEAVIPIYEASDADLSRWTYRGILFRLPKDDVGFFECPNFFRLGDNWVLLCSPYTPVKYFVGSFELETCTFKPKTRGVVDHSGNYYATNVLFDDEHRCVLLAWVRGFKDGRGWNGCMALPRVPSVTPDGHLVQTPVRELDTLRVKHVQLQAEHLANRSHVLDDVRGDALEILVVFEPRGAETFGLKVRRSDGGRNRINIRFKGEILDVAGAEVPLKPVAEGERLTLHIFLDKSVMEVFVNGGRACVTRVIYPGEKDLGVELFAEGGGVIVRSLDVWEMKSVW